MTLRLSLVIDGDPSGAKKALEDTATGVEKLKTSASGAAQPVKEIGAGLTEAADAAPRATEGIGKFSDAAGTGAGKVGSFKSALVGIGAGFAAGVAVGAIAAGLSAAAGAAGEFATSILTNTPMIERDLKSHEELIRRIKGAYNEAEGAASSYGLNSTSVLRFEQQQNIGRLQRDLEAALGDAQAGALHPAADPHGGTRTRDTAANRLIAQFRDDLRDGKADVIAFRNELAALAEVLAEDDPSRATVEALLEQTKVAANLQAELERAQDLLRGLKGDAEAAATALGGSAEKYEALGAAAAGANPELARTNEILDAIASASSRVRLAEFGSAVTVTPGLQFASGGYTGDGARSAVAGTVHRGEFVINAEATRRNRDLLEAINSGLPGFASGGFSGSSSGAGGGYQSTGLIRDLSIVRGELSSFAKELMRTGSLLGALGGAVERTSERFLDLALGALDKLVFGGGGNGFPGGPSGLIGNLFGSLMGGGFPAAPVASAGLYHRGGTVGRAAPSRMAPIAAFIGAPRFHQGGVFGPGERPAIVMEGEEIGWPDQLARKYGGGGTVNHFHIQTPDPRAFAQSRATIERAAGRIAGRSGRHM
jgi:hypothetical protein